MNCIDSVTSNGLCTMCGVCAGVCPQACISMKRMDAGTLSPVIDHDVCNGCGLCLKVCPGVGVDIRGEGGLFGPLSHRLLGPYVKCYVGYASDQTIRGQSSSGGIVTGLLVHSLSQGAIRSAVVTRMKTSSPLMSETVIATSRDEIIASAGSKYCPVAAGEVLRMAMKREESFAFVGLPCHIHGIRKAGKVLPQWKRNPLLIGLFCGYGKTFRLLDAVLEHFAVRRDDVEMVEFRHGGWPGCMRIQTRQGGVHMMPYASYFRREYTPPRCSLCCDGSAEMADISCADAWLPEFRGRFPGVSLVITRTEQGEAAVQQALADKAIILEPIDVAQVIQSQNRMLLRKKSQIGAHRAYRKLLGRTVPEYGIEYTGTRFRDYATALAMNFRIYAANHRSLSIFGKFVTMVRYLVHKRRLRLRQQQRMFVHQREQSHLSRVGQDLPQDETKGRA